jgi:hypothetical protein
MDVGPNRVDYIGLDCSEGNGVDIVIEVPATCLLMMNPRMSLCRRHASNTLSSSGLCFRKHNADS